MFYYKKFSFPMIFTIFFPYFTNKIESLCANPRYSQWLKSFSYLLTAVCNHRHCFQMRLCISIRGHVRPSVRPSVRSVSFSNDESVISYPPMTAKFDIKNDINKYRGVTSDATTSSSLIVLLINIGCPKKSCLLINFFIIKTT